MDKKQKKVSKVMKEFKKGKLSIGKSDKKVKKRKQAIKDLDKYIGNIESKYVTKQAKGGLIRGIPKLAKRGF